MSVSSQQASRHAVALPNDPSPGAHMLRASKQAVQGRSCRCQASLARVRTADGSLMIGRISTAARRRLRPAGLSRSRLGELRPEISHLTADLNSVLVGMPTAPWLITSVIHPANTALCYSRVRSVFTPEQRLIQTLESIRSVQDLARVPNPIVVDLSDLLPEERQAITDTGAHLVRGSGLENMRWSVDGPFKGLGEACMVAALAHTCQAQAAGFWKLSGRYQLTRARPAHERPWGVTAHVSGGVTNTICFGVDDRLSSAYGQWLIDSMRSLSKGDSIEQVTTRFAESRGCLNERRSYVRGQIAVNGQWVDY